MLLTIIIVLATLGVLAIVMSGFLDKLQPARVPPYLATVAISITFGCWIGLASGVRIGQLALLKDHCAFYTQQVTYTKDKCNKFVADTTYSPTWNVHPLTIPIPNPKYYKLDQDTLWLTARFEYQYQIPTNKPPNP